MAIKKDIKENSSPVYFASIEVENVLCFKSPQKLDLCDANGNPARWTVILGDNGVGKTTILRCLVGMEPKYVHSINGGYLSINGEYLLCPRLFKDSSWRIQSSFLSDDTSIRADFIEDHFLTTKKSKFFILKNSCAIFGKEGEHVSTDVRNTLNLYGYGANRQAGKTSLSETLSSDRTLTLFSDNETLINAEEWLLQADYAIARSDSNTSKFQKTFDIVRDTLLQLLPEVTDIRT
jgi:AAA domain